MFDADRQIVANILESVHVDETNSNHVSQFQASFYIKVDSRF